MTDEARIYIVFRADLPEMTRGKGEVQAAHAVGALIYEAILQSPEGRKRVMEYMGHDFNTGRITSGQMKVCLEVADLEALMVLKQRAVSRGVMVVDVTDEGRTVFAGPTTTCLAFGPCSKSDGNTITRGAKLRA